MAVTKEKIPYPNIQDADAGLMHQLRRQRGGEAGLLQRRRFQFDSNSSLDGKRRRLASIQKRNVRVLVASRRVGGCQKSRQLQNHATGSLRVTETAHECLLQLSSGSSLSNPSTCRSKSSAMLPSLILHLPLSHCWRDCIDARLSELVATCSQPMPSPAQRHSTIALQKQK